MPAICNTCSPASCGVMPNLRSAAQVLTRATVVPGPQEYVFFLRAADGKIAFLREYFDPTRAAKAMDRQII